MNLFFSEIYSISRIFLFSFVYKTSSTCCYNCLIQNGKEISYTDLERKPIVQLFSLCDISLLYFGNSLESDSLSFYIVIPIKYIITQQKLVAVSLCTMRKHKKSFGDKGRELWGSLVFLFTGYNIFF